MHATKELKRLKVRLIAARKKVWVAEAEVHHCEDSYWAFVIAQNSAKTQSK